MSCPDCFKGSLHEGTPRGKITEVFGLPTYVSVPEGRPPKGIVVIIPDAFGMGAVNSQLLADRYVDKSDYIVYLPDFMKGKPGIFAPPPGDTLSSSTSLGWAIPTWLLQITKLFDTKGNYLKKLYNTPWYIAAVVPWYIINRPAASYPRVAAFFQSLRSEEPDLPIGVAGFCWGGKQAILLAGEDTRVNDKPLADAVFVGHPGLLDLPKDFEKIQRPTSFAFADKDRYVPQETVIWVKQIMDDKPVELQGEIRVYPNTGHGFCVRADSTFTDIVEQSLLAEDQCIQWFNKHMLREGAR